MKKSAMLTKKSMFHCASCSYHNFTFTEYSKEISVTLEIC